MWGVPYCVSALEKSASEAFDALWASLSSRAFKIIQEVIVLDRAPFKPNTYHSDVIQFLNAHLLSFQTRSVTAFSLLLLVLETLRMK